MTEPNPVESTTNINHSDTVDSYVADLIRKTFGGDIASGETTAPVVLPSKDELTVRLVSQHSLNRLRDAESDRALFDSALWCIIGGILGFFTNVITSGQKLNSSGYVFLSMLGVCLAGLIATRIRVGRRLKDARDRID